MVFDITFMLLICVILCLLLDKCELFNVPRSKKNISCLLDVDNEWRKKKTGMALNVSDKWRSAEETRDRNKDNKFEIHANHHHHFKRYIHTNSSNSRCAKIMTQKCWYQNRWHSACSWLSSVQMNIQMCRSKKYGVLIPFCSSIGRAA